VARVCAYCEKKPVVGNKISHSNIKTKTRHFPNLQKVRAFVGGVAQRVYVCTRCLRSGHLAKPPVTVKTRRAQEKPEGAAATAKASP
jgi:large subunit ribosomal protein L28